MTRTDTRCPAGHRSAHGPAGPGTAAVSCATPAHAGQGAAPDSRPDPETVPRADLDQRSGSGPRSGLETGARLPRNAGPQRRAVLAAGLAAGLARVLGPGPIAGIAGSLAAPAVRAATRDGRAVADALTRARPGETVWLSEPLMLDAPLRVPPGVHLAGSGRARLTAARAMQALVVLAPGAGGALTGVALDGAGAAQYLVLGLGLRDGRIEDCHGTRWRNGILLGRPNGGDPSVPVHGLHLARIRLEAPAPAAIYPLRIRAGNGAPAVRGVVAEDITLIGAGGSYSPKNAATADQFALQGVEDFRLTRIESRDGGENGMTLGRLCRRGVIEDCLIENNDGHGLNAGSGYVAVRIRNTVADPAQPTEGERIAGPGRSRAELQTIRGDRFYLNRLVMGRLAPGDVLTGPDGRWRTTVAAVERSGAMRVARVTARGNWQNRANVPGHGAGLYTQQADGIFFEDCRSGDDGRAVQDWGILYAQSDVGWQTCDLSGNRRGETRGTGESRMVSFPD